jgi:hypothetical protein
MISPQLHPDSSPSCPPPPPSGPLNVDVAHTMASPDEARLAVALGAGMNSRTTTDAVVTGLWHCLLGSLAAGLAVSAVLGLVVLAISQIG